jgi:hypothetical protein
LVSCSEEDAKCLRKQGLLTSSLCIRFENLQIPSTSDSFHFSLYATRTIPNASSILAETAIVSEQQQPSQQASGYHKAEYQTQAERHRKLKSGSEYSGFSKGRLL